jgi:hypothetical protein
VDEVKGISDAGAGSGASTSGFEVVVAGVVVAVVVGSRLELVPARPEVEA